MKTLLAINRIDRGGRVVETRKQHVRSFTQYLMELLYIAHAQIQSAAPRTIYDITGGYRTADVQSPASGYGYRRNKPSLLVASPGGKSQVLVGEVTQYSSASTIFTFDPGLSTLMPGELIGIQIGSSSAAVTPTDNRLASRIPHGRSAPVPAAARQDANLAGDTSDQNLTSWYGCLYVPKKQFDLTSVKFLLYRTGSPGNITIEVKTCRFAGGTTFTVLATTTSNGNTLPTGAPYEWREFVLPGPVTLLPGVPVTIWCQQAAANAIMRKYYNTSGGYGYFLNKQPRFGSADGSSYNSILMDLYGTSPREIEYGACDVSGLTAANPTAQFDIRRLFTNRSGGDITVRECGLYAAFPDTYSGSFCGSGGAVCICRDVISPDLVVGDGEVLAVTYTPQITV
ncbi:MAG: hypothetical protein Q7T33_02110 [Dehalococcoidia bacterium]|nr:hypothetical protein [Dehalococcoidia bacterium]